MIKWTNECSINMTRSELIAKWCADLKQEKVDEFDVDLSSMLDEMIASYNKTLSKLFLENDEMRDIIRRMSSGRVIYL